MLIKSARTNFIAPLDRQAVIELKRDMRTRGVASEAGVKGGRMGIAAPLTSLSLNLAAIDTLLLQQ